MKKLGILMALAMVAGSASAAIILDDADWANAATFYGTGAYTFNGTDVAGDPGYEFTSTFDATIQYGATSTYYGLVFAGVPVANIPADVWHLELENTSTFATVVVLQVVIDDATHTTTVMSPQIASGATYTFDWDLTELGTTVQNLQFATAAFGVQNQAITGVSTTMIPEPATLGLFSVFAGAALFIRKKFMI